MDAAQVAIIVAATRLAEPVVKTGLKLFESLFGESCRVFGDLLADQIYSWQWHNRIQILDRAAKQLEGKAIDPTMMPAGFLIPLLDACGNVEDEGLQDMWANLLTHAMNDRENQSPMFVRILKDLCPEDAKLLLHIRNSQRNHFLDGHVKMVGKLSPSQVRLRTLGLLSGGELVQRGGFDHETRNALHLSEFGRQFLNAVSPPSAAK